VLARRALAVALSGHGHREAAGADRVDADRPRAADAEAGVGIAAELVVVVGEDRDRRDLVGRDVVAQRAGLRARQAAPGELRADRRLVRREVEDAAGQSERFHGGHREDTRSKRARRR
jgi:hypothetical protein